MSFDTSGKLEELATALAELQGELPVVGKAGKATVPTKTGGSYSYSYATLQDVWALVQPLLKKYGLSVIQVPCSAPISFGEKHANVGVSTVLLHKSGASISGTLWLPLSQVTAQGAGSAITYARRYALCAFLGVVADEDDDGKGSEADKPQPRRPERRRDATAPPATVSPTQSESPVSNPAGAGTPAGAVISEPQRKRLYAMSQQFGWRDDEVKSLLKRHGFESSKDVTRVAYDSICKAIEGGTSGTTGEVAH